MVAGRPLEEVATEIARFVREKGDVPTVLIHPHQEWCEYRLAYGWDKWMLLTEAEQSQYIATLRIKHDREFVQSYWPIYGPAIMGEVIDEDKAKV